MGLVERQKRTIKNAFVKVLDEKKKEVYEAATANIKKAQEKQKRDYNSRHKSSFAIKVGDSVLLKNNKRNDRKRGKFSSRWIRPHIVKDLSRKGLTTLENSNDVILNIKYNQSQLKPYTEAMSYKDDEKTDEKYDEKIIENERGKVVIYESTDVSGKEDEQNLDLWNFVPDETLWCPKFGTYRVIHANWVLKNQCYSAPNINKMASAPQLVAKVLRF